MSCLGDLEQGRGDLWHVNLAGYVRVWIWRVSMARHLAGLLGGSSWLIYSAGFQKQEKTYVVEQRKEIERMKCIMVDL